MVNNIVNDFETFQESAAEVANKPLENKIRKLLGDIQKKDMKLQELIEKAPLVSERCYPRFTPNCREKSDLRGTINLITSYLEQANESFQVLQRSDLYFEKRPILIDLADHVQNINANIARYSSLINEGVIFRNSTLPMLKKDTPPDFISVKV